MVDVGYERYGIIAGDSVVKNFGTTTIIGDFGSESASNGIGTVIVSGNTYDNAGASLNPALSSDQNTYNFIISESPDYTVSNPNIGGLTFTPGTTQFTNAGVTIGGTVPTSTVTLNGSGQYYFQIPTPDGLSNGLTTDSTAANVTFIFQNGARASNVLWVINGNVNLNSSGSNFTTFAGSIICIGNITLGTQTTSAGSLSAPFSGTITLNSNRIVCQLSQAILDQTSNNYINFVTTLANSPAIIINAENPAGGIELNAGNNIFERWGPGGLIKTQPAEIQLTDTDGQTLTIAQLLAEIATIPATTNHTVTLDTAAHIVAGIQGVAVNDSFEFILINLSNSTDSAQITIAAGTGGTTPPGQNMIVPNAYQYFTN